MKKRQMLLAVITVCCSVNTGLPQATRQNQSQRTTPITTIRQVDFDNFTYRLPSGDVVRCRRGTCNDVGESEAMSEAMLEKPVYGDLTADGSEEAVVTLVLRFKANSRISDMICFVFTVRGGRVEQLTTLDAFASAVKISRGLLYVDENVSINNNIDLKRKVYRWNGSRLVPDGGSPRRR